MNHVALLQVELAKKGESGLVKLAVPIIPMLDDYECTTGKEAMTKHEAEGKASMEKIWRAIAGTSGWFLFLNL